MEFDFTHASLQEILDYMPDLRREAYVDAAIRMQTDNNIVGVFGSAYSEARSPTIDEALMYGCGLIPVPIVGVDAFIFKHGDYPGCDVIKSTMVYLTTQKCPLLYSAKMYVLDGCCPAVETAFRQCTQKPVHVYKNAEMLTAALQHVYERNYSVVRYQKAQEAFTTLNSLLQQLERSILSGNNFGMIAFYSRFIFELDQRIAFLTRICELVFAANSKSASSISYQNLTSAPAHDPQRSSVCTAGVFQSAPRTAVSVHCPDGIIQKLAPAAGRYFKPIPAQHETADIACAGCIYPARQYVGYEGAGKNTSPSADKVVR